MNPFKALLLLVTISLLGACTVTVQPGADVSVQTVGVRGDRSIDDRLGIQGYPGASVVRREQDDDSSKTTFETGADLDRVYRHFHRQIADQGWNRVELEVKPNKVEAEYRRGGDELELKLHRQGNSGRYRLELKLDD